MRAFMPLLCLTLLLVNLATSNYSTTATMSPEIPTSTDPAATESTSTPSATTNTPTPSPTTTSADTTQTPTSTDPTTQSTSTPSATTNTPTPSPTTTSADTTQTPTSTDPTTQSTSTPSATTNTPAPSPTTTSADTTQTPTSTAPETTQNTSTPSATTNTPAGTSSSSIITAPTSVNAVSTTTVSAVQNISEMSSTPAQALLGTTTLALLSAATSNSTPSSSETSKPNTGTAGFSSLCQDYSCGRDAFCVNLYDTYFCLCTEGYYYASPMCLKGKIFPGEITVNVFETSDLNNENSKAYQDLHNNVTTFFKEAFNTSDYGQTVIFKVSILSSLSASPQTNADDNYVNVSVVNIFQQNTAENQSSVSDAIKTAIQQTSTIVEYYTSQDLCDHYGCENNGQDDCDNGVQCTCLPGLQRLYPQSLYCTAVGCSENCTEDFKKQCIKDDQEQFECVCLPGYKKDAKDNCQECPFGYSGMECKDQFQLILTIVGTIAGILILSLVIGLIFSARSKNRTKNIEEQKLIEDDFHNVRMQQTGFSNPAAPGSIFPKVRTATSRDGQAQNPYVMQRSGLRPDY